MNQIQPRLSLQATLEKILGSNEVYFQPPNGKELKYPCILYKLGDIDVKRANGCPYLKSKLFTVTAIDRDPDSPLPDLIGKLPYATFDRFYTSSNLNHWVYKLYFEGGLYYET